jgi:hypothetical protein
MAARKKTTSSAKPAAKKAAPRSTKKYLRNLTGYEVGIRLERQEKGQKRFDLKPRGQRGDLVPLQKDDTSDPAVTENEALGVVEIITEAEATKIIQGQSTNQQAPVHPAQALLRNELGEPIESVVLEPPEADRGTVVARLDDGQLASDGPGINWERSRRDPGIEDASANNQSEPRRTSINPAEVRADGVVGDKASAEEAADAAARRSDATAHDLLKVTVAPTQKG